MSIMVVGDTHAWFGPLNKIINKKKPDMILVCGDFGWWRPYHNTRGIVSSPDKIFNQFSMKNWNTKVYWADGNHEHFWGLKEDTKETNEVMPNVFYQKRGSYITLPDGRNVMFFGGAESTDKIYRKVGIDWFPEETITHRDIEDLPDVKIDIVISHTAPISFELSEYIIFKQPEDTSRHALQYILERYKPSSWYFGHFHTALTGRIGDCKYYGMGAVVGPKTATTNWWRWLNN